MTSGHSAISPLHRLTTRGRGQVYRITSPLELSFDLRFVVAIA